MVQRPSATSLLFNFASETSTNVAKSIDAVVQPRRFIPLRRDFLRSRDGEITPLKRLFTGGRGGRNALLLYLGHMWLATKHPFAINGRGAYGWASLLDLDVETRNGARIVQRSLKKLEDLNLLSIIDRPGKPPIVTMLREDGSGDDYYFPGDPVARESRGVPAERDLYLRFTTRWWLSGVLPTLTGPELVMLLTMIDAGADKDFVWISGEQFKQRYQLSPSTRYVGIEGLVDRSILTAEHIPVQPLAGRVAWEAPRKRHQHALNDIARAVSLEDTKSARAGKRQMRGTGGPADGSVRFPV